jgi:hypothetical protein
VLLSRYRFGDRFVGTSHRELHDFPQCQDSTKCRIRIDTGLDNTVRKYSSLTCGHCTVKLPYLHLYIVGSLAKCSYHLLVITLYILRFYTSGERFPLLVFFTFMDIYSLTISLIDIKQYSYAFSLFDYKFYFIAVHCQHIG